MEELGLGPNGALLYCMEYLLENLDWLHGELEQFGDDDYILLDCPGQIELYTHVPVQKRLIEAVAGWGYAGSLVSVFCIDAAFCIDASKFLSGALLSLSAMIALELPQVSVLTKCDLISTEEVDRILDYGSASELWGVEQDRQSLMRTVDSDDVTESNQRLRKLERRRLMRNRLTHQIGQLLDDWQMISFVPLNLRDEDSIDTVFATINQCIQYGEDAEVKGADRNDDAEPDDS
jgi:GPN-loop GTPase